MRVWGFQFTGNAAGGAEGVVVGLADGSAGRLASFPAQAGKGLREVPRYVEGNARRAKLVDCRERARV